MKQKILIAALSASGILVATCKSRQSSSDQSGIRDGLTKLADSIRFNRFKKSVAPVIKSVMEDPTEVGASLRTAINEKEVAIFTAAKAEGDGLRRIRLGVAGLSKRVESLELMAESCLRELRRRAVSLRTLFKESSAKGTSVVLDELVIGSGPQGVAYVQKMTDLNPNKVIVIVDRADKPGGTFANAEDAWFLNSTNRQNTGNRAQPGQGDLNNFNAILGLPDFRAQKWTPAGGLGKIAAVATDVSGAHWMGDTDVVEILDRLVTKPTDNWPARYRVKMRNVTNGEEYISFTDKVIVSTGIGEPIIPIKDPATLSLIAAERAKVSADTLDAVPGIQTFNDAIYRIAESETPYRPYVNKTIAVVGGGDSANVLNEFFTRIGPEASYGRDVAQVGNVDKIYWIGVDFDTCEQYIAKSRGRYAALQSAINNGKLIPVPARVDTIAKVGEKFKLQISYRTAEANTASALQDGRQLAPGRVRYALPKDQGGQIVEADVDMDNIILATGFKSKADELLKGVVNIANTTPIDASIVPGFVRIREVELGVENGQKVVRTGFNGFILESYPDIPNPYVVVTSSFFNTQTGQIVDTIQLESFQGRNYVIQPGDTSSVAFKDFLKPLEAPAEGFDQPRVTVATRLVTDAKATVDSSGQVIGDATEPQQIYFIGPANEVRGGLPKSDELAKVNANTVSLFANVKRSEALARVLAETTNGGATNIREILEGGVAQKLVLSRMLAPEPGMGQILIRDAKYGKPKNLPVIAEDYIKTGIAKLLQDVEAPESTLKMLVDKAPDAQGSMAVRVSFPQLDGTSETQLVNRMAEDPQFCDTLFSYFAPKSNTKTLEVNIPFFSKNTDARIGKIEVFRRTELDPKTINPKPRGPSPKYIRLPVRA